MLRDITDWEHIGYGGKSTLEKEELRSPEGLKYLIKYPRPFEVGVSWEDITELIAAEIGKILGLEMMKVEMVIRKGKRGCLLRNFVEEYDALMAEEGGALLTELVEEYKEVQECEWKNLELIHQGFQMIQKFPHWEFMKSEFIDMQLFDILIGNQDRHPYNWQLLFLPTIGAKFSPIYDNGASLGFRFDEDQLKFKAVSEQEMNKYTKNARVKAGLFENKSVKAKDTITYISEHFPIEFEESAKKLAEFDIMRYSKFINSLDVLSKAKKEWLLNIIPFRRKKILEWIGKEE
ncbi:HipA domain-containing protein [Bacillus sp. EB600]|uniref:HipA domain-containing protein n=1 Tax=Bacillus sp. EB600 TaxID=2806345 RepID=UPI002108E2E7|nr:HipA domain-containing protein [Bacillus sp. EB600]MCQ6282365.1 HipA domain-containing protein [Bacillus sp. EB600]